MQPFIPSKVILGITSHIIQVAAIARLAETCRVARDTLRALLEITQIRKSGCARLMQEIPLALWSGYVSSRGRIIISALPNGTIIITPKSAEGTRGTIMHFLTTPLQTTQHSYKRTHELKAFLTKHALPKGIL